MMMKIKEFADFYGVTVKTLQLYDRLGLFKPAHVDADTGYRYYREDQMTEFNTIVSLKNTGFRLKEIVDMKQKHYTREQVVQCLSEKKKEQMIAIENIEAVNIHIDEMIVALGGVPPETLTPEELLTARLSRLAHEDAEHDFSKIIWL